MDFSLYDITKGRHPRKARKRKIIMADKAVVLKGKAEWLLRKADKFSKYRFNFYPADASVRKQIKELGLRNKLNENKDGELFYKFQTKEGGTQPWITMDANGSVYEGAVGNGSEVEVHLIVETFPTKEHGDVTRSYVSKVVITKLVEYVAPKKEEAVAEGAKEELPV
jgi:hypothetical protein